MKGPSLAETAAVEQEASTGAVRRRTGVRQQAWRDLASGLALALGALAPGQFLVVGTRDPDPYYVQFRRDGDGTVLGEAVSNRFLCGWRSLDRIAEDRLRRLRWRPPIDIGAGSRNWWRQAAPDATADLAEVAVATLTKVYDVARVDQLAYRAGAIGGAALLLPWLGLDQRDDPTIDEQVTRTFTNLLGLADLVRDDDGDIPIDRDGQTTYVRVVDDPGYAAIFCPVLWDVEPTAELLEAVNTINGEIRCARACWRDRTVLIASEVADGPLMRPHLVDAYEAVSTLASGYRKELRDRFGDDTGAPDTGYGFYL